MSYETTGQHQQQPQHEREFAPRASLDVQEALAALRHAIESARPIIMSSSSSINKEEVLRLVDEVQVRMPEEIRAARWLLKEREEYKAKMYREGEEIVALARNRAEQLVQRTQVVRAAEARARVIIEQAEAEGRRMQREAEDYCDKKLGSFENVLQRTLQQVDAGRNKLRGNLLDQLGDGSDASHPLDDIAHG